MIRILFESEEDSYKWVRIKSAFDYNFIKYESNGVTHNRLEEYLQNLRTY